MPNPAHLKILNQGVIKWNEWRKTVRMSNPDLSNANLSERDLSAALLIGVNLTGAVLKDAYMPEAILDHAKITRSDFSGATLDRASLVRVTAQKADFRDARFLDVSFVAADLSDASFRDAVLFDADFHCAKLKGSIFTQAILGETRFTQTDLSETLGLEEVVHSAPSVLDIETFVRSQGKIPATFLEGVGVPNAFIEYAKALTLQPLEFYSCFISYSSRDQEFAKRLHTDLQSKDVRCWFAPEDLKIGDKFRLQIDESIRLHDKLLLVLSEHSVNSDWVEKEVETAMERERQEKRTVLFPIRLDDSVMDIPNGWPADIRRSRHIGDFTKWKNHDDYQKALDRLLRDLKANEMKSGGKK